MRAAGKLILAAAALAFAGPATGGSPLPFSPEFEREVEEAFFEAGALSPEKLAGFRERVERRRREAIGVFEAEQRARGRGRKAAHRRALRRKEVRVFDLLLGSPATPGWLDRLAGERDGRAARELAARILEVEQALRLEGQRPSVLRVPENLVAISVLPWTVPGRTRVSHAEREASNLWNPAEGAFYTAEELAERIRAGGDVSRLDPPPDSGFWRDPGRIAEIDVRRAYLGGGHPLHAGLSVSFPREGARFDSVKKSQTKPKFEVEVDDGEEEREFKLKVGGEVHSEPTAGALLAALGFNTDLVIPVENFRIDLGETSVDEVRDEWRSYFEFKRIHMSYRFDDYFEVGEDERGAFLVARRASLTHEPDEVIRVGPWAWGGPSYAGQREVRALAVFAVWIGNTDLKEAENNKLVLRARPDGRHDVFYVLHDPGHAFGRVVSEQIDAFPWDLARRTWTGRIRFNFHSTWNPSVRTRITHADARWAARLIAQLTREQIADAVELGAWPEPVARLLVEKLVNRRNQLVETFDLEGEATPSGAIALLPVDRGVETPGGEVVAGELREGVFPGETQDFDSYWSELLGPVWERARLFGVGVFQQSIGLVPALIFDRDSVGVPRVVILELIITLRRDIDENPYAGREGHFYLVRDRLRLGVRAGAGLIGTATTDWWRAYTLVQPAGTLEEAHFASDTILNVLLPFHVWRGELPEEFVLVRESYRDGKLGATLETFAGSVPPVGASGRVGVARVTRDVLARRDGRLLAYRDGSSYREAEVEAWLNLVFVRLPFGRQQGSRGTLEGELFELPTEATGGDPEWSDALSRLIRDGDFSGLEERLEARTLRSRFRSRAGWVGMPLFLRRARIDRFDDVEEGPRAERLLQYRRAEGAYWDFLDLGEESLHTVIALAPPAGPGGETKRPRIVSTYYQRDLDTFDDELGTYLAFANGVAAGHGRLIEFTPELHGANRRWGDLEVGVRIGYSRKGVERLRRIEPDELWPELAARLGLERAELERLRRRLATTGKLRWPKRRSVPHRDRTALLAAEASLRALARARGGEGAARGMRRVADALAEASIRTGGGFEPSVLGALHALLEPGHFSVDLHVAPPPWKENRLLGSVPLQASTPGKAKRLDRPFLDFAPHCTGALHVMLEGLAGEDPLAARFGDACDGARGSFDP